MTYREAFVANMIPYRLPESSVEFLLSEQGLDIEEDWEPGGDARPLMRAVVEGLWQVIMLVNEKDTGSSQTYDTDLIKKRILRVKRKYGIEDEAGNDTDNGFIDRTSEW